MNLVPTSDQREIATMVAEVLENSHPLSRLLDDDGGRLTSDEWAEIGALNWFGLGLPESDGGVALGPAEEMMLFVELGRGLFPGPASCERRRGSSCRTQRSAGDSEADSFRGRPSWSAAS